MCSTMVVFMASVVFPRTFQGISLAGPSIARIKTKVGSNDNALFVFAPSFVSCAHEVASGTGGLEVKAGIFVDRLQERSRSTA